MRAFLENGGVLDNQPLNLPPEISPAYFLTFRKVDTAHRQGGGGEEFERKMQPPNEISSFGRFRLPFFANFKSCKKRIPVKINDSERK
jgi:hypothetical protein